MILAVTDYYDPLARQARSPRRRGLMRWLGDLTDAAEAARAYDAAALAALGAFARVHFSEERHK